MPAGTATPPVERAILGGGFMLVEIPDPGNAGAIPTSQNGRVHIVTRTAETRTLARPRWEGQLLFLVAKSIAMGNCVVTASAAINQAGNNTITMNGADEAIGLMGTRMGDGLLYWRVLFDNTTALTTV